jgi:hypothetical protein
VSTIVVGKSLAGRGHANAKQTIVQPGDTASSSTNALCVIPSNHTPPMATFEQDGGALRVDW